MDFVLQVLLEIVAADIPFIQPKENCPLPRKKLLRFFYLGKHSYVPRRIGYVATNKVDGNSM